MTTPLKLTPEEKPQSLEFIPYDDDQQGSDFIPEAYTIDATDNPVKHKSITGTLIKSEVLLSQGEEQRKLEKFIWQLIDENGKIVGIFDKNPALNTLVYNFEFLDGAIKQSADNVIDMNILIQVDSDGHNSKTLDGIVDYKRDDSAVSKVNAFIMTNRGVRIADSLGSLYPTPRKEASLLTGTKQLLFNMS